MHVLRFCHLYVYNYWCICMEVCKAQHVCMSSASMYAWDAPGENSDNLGTETCWYCISVILGPDVASRQRKGLEHLACFSSVLWGGREGSQGEESRGGQGDWLSGGIRSESGGWTQTWPRTSSQPAPIKYIIPLFQHVRPAGLLYHFHMCVCRPSCAATHISGSISMQRAGRRRQKWRLGGIMDAWNQSASLKRSSCAKKPYHLLKGAQREIQQEDVNWKRVNTSLVVLRFKNVHACVSVGFIH